uniref:Protein max n=1 Tax=Ascaris suum TaxID=6253 RepID=F1L9Z5_ASCSU
MSDVELSDADEDMAMDTLPTIDTKKHARAQHNALERRRRDNIKDMYGALKDTIPGMSSERASRAVILKKAIDMIVNMEEQLKSIVAENEHLEQVNAELEAELMRLEGGTVDVTLNQNEGAGNGTMALDIRSVPEVKPSSSYDYTTKHASNSQGQVHNWPT